MPCYTERTVTVALEAADIEVLGRALKGLGFTNVIERDGAWSAVTTDGDRIYIGDGTVSLRGSTVSRRSVEAVAGSIKRAYAAEAVRTAAKRYGWNVKTNPQTGQLTLNRKSF